MMKLEERSALGYLKPPQRFLISKDRESEEMATWINWIHLETQALLEDLNEEIRLQNKADNPSQTT